jgi:argininosuccinate lyase
MLTPEREPDIRGVLGVRNALAAFVSEGSTAPDRVRAQLGWWKERLTDAA